MMLLAVAIEGRWKGKVVIVTRSHELGAALAA